jgi:hypothetical protein
MKVCIHIILNHVNHKMFLLTGVPVGTQDFCKNKKLCLRNKKMFLSNIGTRIKNIQKYCSVLHYVG